VRLDTAKDKTHRLAVELFSGFGNEQPAELQCWWLLRLTNRKIWRSHAALSTGAQKHQNPTRFFPGPASLALRFVGVTLFACIK
jgi:hypothetical protein